MILAAPNAVWDARNGWPNFQMAHALSNRQGGPLGSLAHLPLLAVLLAGPALIALWVIGVRSLASPRARAHRWILAATVVVVVVFTATGGKAYYPAPALAPLFAAGAVRIEGLVQTRRRQVRWSLAIAVSAAITLIVGLPVLPARGATALRPINPELMQTYGWPQLVSQVAQAAAPLPPNTPIFTSGYGEAGALTLLRPRTGLPNPIYSAQNNYALWGPPPGRPDTVLCVGTFSVDYLRRFWNQVSEIAPITLPAGLRNNETARGAAIYLCQQPRGSWAQLWPALRHYDRSEA